MEKNISEKWNGNVEIINTGVSGFRAGHHLATLKHIMQYEPDMLIFLVGFNDWNLHICSFYAQESYDPTYWDQMQFKRTLLGKFWKKDVKDQSQSIVRHDRGDYFSRQRNSLNRD